MKRTKIELVMIALTLSVISFFAGYYVHDVMIQDTILIETETVPSPSARISEKPTASQPAETTELEPTKASAEAAATISPSQEPPEEPTEADVQEKVNLNTATAEELDVLPGIGPVLAQRIIEYRENQGGFQTAEEIVNVSGIGEKTYAKLANLVEVGEP